LAELCNQFYQYPAEKLKVIGVTGTNGKTTTTHLIYETLKKAGLSVGEVNEQKQLFTITDKGKDTLRYFINRIPQRQLDRVDELLKEKKHEIKVKSQVTADYIKAKEGEYLVNLKVVEGDVTIINISLNVASTKQAKQVCETWQGNVQEIYGTLINQLIKEPKEKKQ